MHLFHAYLPLVLGCCSLLLASIATGEEVKESTATFDNEGTAITVERFEPADAKGDLPAVLVVHGADGFRLGGMHYRRTARTLAEHGYVAFLVHYFEQTDTKFGDARANVVNFIPWMRTVSEGLSYVEKQPGVDAKHVGLLGVSLGAYLSLSIAAVDTRVGAVVEVFGGMPERVAKNLKRMPPTLILHGDADKIVSVEEAHKLERLLKEKQFTFESKIYAGQGHGFMGEDDKDSKQRIVAFFDKYLKAAK